MSGWLYFFLTKGRALHNGLSGFKHLTDDDKKDLDWRSITGTGCGYDMILWGRQEVIIKISPESVSSEPLGHESNIQLNEGNAFTLRGGTKLVPIRDTSKGS